MGPDSAGCVATRVYTLAWDDLERQREGYDLAVGWKITPKTKVEGRYFYSHFGEPEHQHRLVVTAINPALNAGGKPGRFQRHRRPRHLDVQPQFLFPILESVARRVYVQRPA